MTKRHRKRFSLSLIIREMQFNTWLAKQDSAGPLSMDILPRHLCSRLLHSEKLHSSSKSLLSPKMLHPEGPFSKSRRHRETGKTPRTVLSCSWTACPGGPASLMLSTEQRLVSDHTLDQCQGFWTSSLKAKKPDSTIDHTHCRNPHSHFLWKLLGCLH